MKNELGEKSIPYRLPLVISVTGHRDLVPQEIEAIRKRIRMFFENLRTEHPQHDLTVLNPLAVGADQLVAEVALDMDVELVVPLPKPLDDYRNDFRDPADRQKFEELLARASRVFELRLDHHQDPNNEQTEVLNGAPYAKLGIFLCSHCHILLAIWDGKRTDEVGGTSQVVQFHHDDFIPGITRKSIASQKGLVDDESDLVFHIVCSRDRNDGSPSLGLTPADWFWFTKDIDHPLSKELPDQHKRIFSRGAEFNCDVERYAEAIEAGKTSLIPENSEAALPEGIEEIDRLFSMADWLAIHFKRRTQWTLFITHSAAFAMGLMFLLYSDLDTRPAFMYLFLFFFLTAASTHWLAKNRGWQRKHLDYRSLAEGLRVQFYWAAAGITNDAKWRFAHDSYLQTQDPEFGWIRNVMRVAGTRYDAMPSPSEAGLAFAINEWVGDGKTGQLGYFKHMATDRISRDKITKILDRASLLTSAVAVIIFLLFGNSLSEFLATALFLTMGSALLLFGVREAYSYATAVKELIKQYEFMLRIFDSAHRRLNQAEDSEEKRQILLTLGQSALEEHSDWILMHHERSLDQSEIWRMGN